MAAATPASPRPRLRNAAVALGSAAVVALALAFLVAPAGYAVTTSAPQVSHAGGRSGAVVYGRVVDHRGHAVAHARVVLSGRGAPARTVTTSRSGTYRMVVRGSGADYRIGVRARGAEHIAYGRSHVRVTPGSAYRVDADLRPHAFVALIPVALY